MTIAVTGLGIGVWVGVVLYAVAGRGCWPWLLAGGVWRCSVCWGALLALLDAFVLRRERCPAGS